MPVQRGFDFRRVAVEATGDVHVLQAVDGPADVLAGDAVAVRFAMVGEDHPVVQGVNPVARGTSIESMAVTTAGCAVADNSVITQCRAINRYVLPR